MKRNNYSVHHEKRKQSKEEKKSLKQKNKIENKNKIGLNQILKPIIFLVLAIVLEIVNYSILGLKTFGKTNLFPKYIFFDFGFWLIICGLLLACSKNWIANTIFYISIFVQLLLCAVNATLYSEFGYLFTWDMIGLALEAIDSFDISFVQISSALLYLGILIFIIALPLVIDKLCKNKKFDLHKLAKPIFCLICFICCFSLGTGTFGIQIATLGKAENEQYTEIESDLYLYQNMHIREEAFKRFGTCGFYVKNLYDLIAPKPGNKDKAKILEELKASVVKKNDQATLYGDNLIVIMMESYEWFAIDPYTTPNLWMLKTGESSSTETTVPNQAVVMNRYYANNKTNVSEDVALLGYMPNVNNYTVKGTDTIATAYSLPNLFKKLGYTANYFHNFEPTFYERNKTNINIGFEKFYSIKDFKHENKGTTFFDWNLEADFAEQFMNEIAPTDKKFMSFYTTVSTHGTYDKENPRFSKYYATYDKHLDEIKSWFASQGYKYPESAEEQQILRLYKSAAIDTDAMIGKLFKHLNQNNLTEKTTVVLYADHNSYFHDLTYKIKKTDKSDLSELFTHNIPLMIYSEKLSAKLSSNTVSAFCNNYDIYPTICELFGLEHNTMFTQGYNIFSTKISNSMHYSYLTGYYSETYYSKNMVEFKKYKTNSTTSLDKFKENVCAFYRKQKKLEAIYHGGWKTSELK